MSENDEMTELNAARGDTQRIHQEHDALRGSLERLTKLSVRLQERLEPVLSPRHEELTQTREPEPATVLSPLAGQLIDDRGIVDHVSERLSDICDRLET